MNYPLMDMGLLDDMTEALICLIANPGSPRYDEPLSGWNLTDEEFNSIISIINDLLPFESDSLYITAPIRNIAISLGLIHKELGGLEVGSDMLMKLSERALSYYLREMGVATQNPEGSYMLARGDVLIYGEGKNWVYLYFFRDEKVEYQRKFDGKIYDLKFPCNIGCTKDNPKKRIYQQTGSLDNVIIHTLFRENKHKELERLIHAWLRYRGQRIPPALRDGEREWFLTNPDEVRDLHRVINGSNW